MLFRFNQKNVWYKKKTTTVFEIERADQRVHTCQKLEKREAVFLG